MIDVERGILPVMLPIGNRDAVAIDRVVRPELRAQRLPRKQLTVASVFGVRLMVDLEAGRPAVPLANAHHVLVTSGCDLSLVKPSGPSR
ncbi:MAG: hypothetical protein DI605_17990 [Sphingomonas sp.]|nr:MAG: hypothetical protein DI605_17990 [Sphingomonas sp.]